MMTALYMGRIRVPSKPAMFTPKGEAGGLGPALREDEVSAWEMPGTLRARTSCCPMIPLSAGPPTWALLPRSSVVTIGALHTWKVSSWRELAECQMVARTFQHGSWLPYLVKNTDARGHASPCFQWSNRPWNSPPLAGWVGRK